MENDKQKLSPAERLQQELKDPLISSEQARNLNNATVALFVEGKLTADQCAKASLDLARAADEYSNKVFATDVSTKKMPETKWMGFSSLQAVAQESRQRALTLTLEKQRQAQPPDRVVPLRPNNRRPPTQK